MASELRAFVTTLPKNVAALFAGRRLLWQLAAIALTALVVTSGFDWWYFQHTRAVPPALYFPAIIMGALLPVVTPVVLLIVGFARHKEAWRRTGFALGQAALIAFVISSAYKAVTGRVEPPTGASLIDTSGNFNFGFLEYGIFWGWPSGHTTTAFAMAVTLVAGHARWVAVGALAYAFYIGLSVSVQIHWFSEFAAGAIVGSLIGVVVGSRWCADRATLTSPIAQTAG